MKDALNSSSRIQAIDIVRGITISLVVMGHTEMPSQLNNVFSAFRMPLFFMVSGYLLNVTKYSGDFLGFIHTRIWRLLIPYFSASIFFYLIWIIKQYYNPIKELFWYEPLIGILYGNGETLYVNVPIWFLICLFCSEILFLMIMSLIHSYNTLLQALLFIVVGYIGFCIGNYIHLPWGLDIAFVIQLFLYIGNKFKSIGLFKTFYFPINFIIVSIILFIITNPINGLIDINNRIYGNIFLFYINGILGSIIMLYIAQLLGDFKAFSQTFIYFGKNSINILIFHTATFSLLNMLNKLTYTTLLSHWLVYTLFGILMSLSISYIVKRHPLLRMIFNGVR
ncbi:MULTISPECIES: acyltransferase family protein [Bacillus cereus group]|uniref:acyltransferase family protein n=1 Tax=Bacillus cereus group TaxID=86661 RepID=UPI001E48A234|nr:MULTISPECIES: acyltransferase family protein [Bacillus cereus group]HDR7253094.1 acyltransferase family protein [Bacillus pacificus]MCC2399299.1 acyltransferase family protein [Bacillus paranthracis]MCU5122632.1 acyltransferase family protein [Bacillus paranthracis]MCU5368356.1 acyltransferase family protein [Bacillus paranthracis]MCU5606948.1 acyltransferase family protein [Bacillus paranthracis]